MDRKIIEDNLSFKCTLFELEKEGETLKENKKLGTATISIFLKNTTILKMPCRPWREPKRCCPWMPG